jgi:hypothetical protein
MVPGEGNGNGQSFLNSDGARREGNGNGQSLLNSDGARRKNGQGC